MPSAAPAVILRLGSHAEKEYFVKTVEHWNGLIVGANLFEAAPGATASLIFKFAGNKHKVPYYVDPMTYAFGAYVENGVTRTDLDWIKSDQKVKDPANPKKKKIQRLYKRSYRSLADEYGGAVLKAVESDTGISTLSTSACKQLAEAVIEYQRTRVRREFQADPEYADFADDIPEPTAIFAPYFYIDPGDADQGLTLFERCTSAAAEVGAESPIHAVFCTDVSTLSDINFLQRVASLIKQTGVAGVWLWFSCFYEEKADRTQLRNFRTLIEDLRTTVEVYNMHGGFLSIAMSRVGLNGASHGVGYGEQKDVIPVIGQSTPTVRYYLPDLRRRLSVPQIERAFKGIGVATPEQFFEKVCGCAICRGVIQTDVTQFSAFGDLHYSTAQSKRMAQTPAAAQRCRFHFLLNRMRERDEIGTRSAEEIADEIRAAYNKWKDQPTIRGDVDHLPRWEATLRD